MGLMDMFGGRQNSLLGALSYLPLIGQLFGGGQSSYRNSYLSSMHDPYSGLGNGVGDGLDGLSPFSQIRRASYSGGGYDPFYTTNPTSGGLFGGLFGGGGGGGLFGIVGGLLGGAYNIVDKLTFGIPSMIWGGVKRLFGFGGSPQNNNGWGMSRTSTPQGVTPESALYAVDPRSGSQFDLAQFQSSGIDLVPGTQGPLVGKIREIVDRIEPSATPVTSMSEYMTYTPDLAERIYNLKQKLYLAGASGMKKDGNLSWTELAPMIQMVRNGYQPVSRPGPEVIEA